MMDYRKEIDGLRALAVLAVIFFHAGFKTFSGGFVGVDVFFVISGYLITSMIIAEREAGSFSLLKFYERRARRILPALLLVIIACLPFAWILLPQPNMESFSESLIAVSLFTSNIFFLNHSGYFDTNTNLQPLIHTWSLSVEEQYYLLFPVFLLLLTRYCKKKLEIFFLIIIALISFALADFSSFKYASESAFYLLPTRGWELLIGALIAYYLRHVSNNISKIHKYSQLGSLVGFLLICYAIFVFNDNTPFPGRYALVPTLGAAFLILFANPQTHVGRLLGNKLLVSIGLISYSAYLWHQPLFAYTRLWSIEDISSFRFLVLSIVSLILAYFSWKYVEQPFRNKNNFSRTSIFTLSIVFVGLIIIVGVYGHVTQGLVIGGYTNRLQDRQKEIADFIKYDYIPAYQEGVCDLTPKQSFKDFAPSCKKVVNIKESILIWGDSHAAALAAGFRTLSPNVIQYTSSACPPIMDIEIKIRSHCKKINDYVLSEIASLKPSIIMLHARWTNDSNYHIQNPDIEIIKTVKRILKVSPASKVYIVGSVPLWRQLLPLSLANNASTLDKIEYDSSPFFDELKSFDNKLQIAATQNGISFLSALDVMCKNEQCLTLAEIDGKLEPTAFDDGHLGKAGYVLLAKNLASQIKQKN